MRAEQSVLAPTTAAPTMTLTGVIESKFKDYIATLEKGKQFTDPIRSNPLALTTDKRFNPLGKTLNPQQEKDLFELAASQSEGLAKATDVARQASHEALWDALKTGQIRTMETILPSATISRTEAAKRNEATGARIMEELSAQHGKWMEDWAAMSIATKEPDGVHRKTSVIYTRHRHPAAFHAKDNLAKLRLDYDEELRQFFNRLP